MSSEQTLPTKTLRIVSLGAGMQSSALLMLAIEGRVAADCAIFADTGWEPQSVYDNLAVLTDHAEREGFPLYTVTAGNIFDDWTSGNRQASVPFYLRNPDGTDGILNRQCTGDYKIGPLRRKARELAGYHASEAPHPPPNTITFLQGISLDEIQRVKPSDVQYVKLEYPLVFDFKPPWRRADCAKYLRQRWNIEAPKSACVGCPYMGDRRWLNLTDSELDEAERFECAAQAAPAIEGVPFLHKRRVPIREAVATVKQWHADNQPLFGDEFDDLCDSGACGV